MLTPECRTGAYLDRRDAPLFSEWLEAPYAETMTNRRALMGSAAAGLAQLLLPRSWAANQVVFQHDLPDVNLHGWSVTAVEVNYPLGGSSTAHRHRGITIVYVLEGEVPKRNRS